MNSHQSTTEMITDFLANPRVEDLGHIDQEGRYKSGKMRSLDIDLQLEASLGQKYNRQVSFPAEGNSLVQDPGSPYKAKDLMMTKGTKMAVTIQATPKQEMNMFAEKPFKTGGMGKQNPVAQEVEVKVDLKGTPPKTTGNKPKPKNETEKKVRQMTPDSQLKKQKEASVEGFKNRPVADRFVANIEERNLPNLTTQFSKTSPSPNFMSKGEVRPLKSPVSERMMKLNGGIQSEMLVRAVNTPTGAIEFGTKKFLSEKNLQQNISGKRLLSPAKGKRKMESPEKVE